MSILDQVTQMQNQGKSETEIVNALKEQGVTPKEINDSLSQAQIKNAVSPQQSMQPSVMQQDSAPTPQNNYSSQTQEMSEGYYPQEQYPQSQEYYPQQSYDNYAQTDTDTMIEIASQVFSEKIKKLQKQTTELNEFQTIYKTKIDNLSERLKKMEDIINKLQLAILDKVGSYGKNLDNIKKEMNMMQESFRKTAPRKHHTTTKKKATSKKHKK